MMQQEQYFSLAAQDQENGVTGRFPYILTAVLWLRCIQFLVECIKGVICTHFNYIGDIY